MSLRWSARALEDRVAILEFVSAESPRAAVAIDAEIKAEVEALIGMPERGRRGRVTGTRELVLPKLPYIAVYRIDGDTIRIVRIIHAARQWPKQMPRR